MKKIKKTTFHSLYSSPEIRAKAIRHDQLRAISPRLRRAVKGIIGRRKRGRSGDLNVLMEIGRDPPELCACCGDRIDYSDEAGLKSPSFDRVNNAKGYVRGNVQIICKECNRRKGDLTPELLIRLQTYLVTKWPNSQ